MRRIVNVVRMQLINTQTYIWVPLMVFGGVLLLTLAIFAIIHNAGAEGPMYAGSAQGPLWYFGVVGVQALTLTFPFSQAMSVTRREFYLGTLLTAIMTSAILAALFVICGMIELATGGWGMNGFFAYIPWVWDLGPLAAAVFYFAVSMMFFTVGFWAATIYKRFGSVVLTTVLLGIAVLLVAALFLLTQANAWMHVFAWIGAQAALGLSLWGLALIVVLAGISYVTLRRTVP